jgi:hypothetical protein
MQFNEVHGSPKYDHRITDSDSAVRVGNHLPIGIHNHLATAINKERGHVTILQFLESGRRLESYDHAKPY